MLFSAHQLFVINAILRKAVRLTSTSKKHEYLIKNILILFHDLIKSGFMWFYIVGGNLNMAVVHILLVLYSIWLLWVRVRK